MSSPSPQTPSPPATNAPVNCSNWRVRLYRILFETEGEFGARAFDIMLVVAILASVVIVMLDSVKSIADEHGELLHGLEWGFTVLFTLEYAARLIAVRKKRRYIFSFLGIIDLLAILPTYLDLLFPGARFATIIRVIRVLRVFRILKLMRYLGEARSLRRALVASRYRIAVFLICIMTLVVVLGSLMYLIEGGPDKVFSSIPVAVYWAVVTLTTVGFGDITPETAVGQFMAAIIMLMGYGLIAVPTGIVSVELAQAAHDQGKTATPAWETDRVCASCRSGGHDVDASFCKTCGGTIVDVEAKGNRPEE